MKKNNSAYSNQTGTANANMNGAYWTGITDYSTNPAGVNPQFVKYLAANGLLGNGDPLTKADINNLAGGRYDTFWKMVFPQGANDCDLQAAISNMTDKINQLNVIANTPRPAGIPQYVTYNPIVVWVQANVPKPQQGDAAEYINSSLGNLRGLLQQYNATYNSHIPSGGGCSEGLTTANYLAYQTAQTNEANNIKTQKDALALEAQENAQKIEEGLAAQNAFAANSAAGSAMQGAAAGSAAGGSILGLAPVTLIMYAVMGVIVIGGIAYFAHKKNNPAQ